MLLNRIITLSITLLAGMQLYSQCGCTDCPVNTISNGTVTSTINISGATNNVLGSGGQELISMFLDYDTDAVNEVNMTLYAPNGSSVLLMQQTGISVNQNISFLICFNGCSQNAIPDPGFDEFFDSDGGYQPNTDYGGTYYPTNANLVSGVGCLESLTGPVNGDWVLEIQDVISFDDGVINDWFLVFADNDGTDCTNALGCALAEMACDADGGELNNQTVNACVGDPTLDVTMTPEYPGSTPPDNALFGYYAVVYDAITGVIIEYVDDPDFSDFPVGSYSFCGLSYLLDDEALITAIDDINTLADLTADIANDVFCGDLSEGCGAVNVLAEPDPILVGPDEVCAGELVSYMITNVDLTTINTFLVNSGSFSFFEVIGNTLNVIFESGPVQLCGTATNLCGTFTDCMEVIVNPYPLQVEIDGDMTVCPEDLDNYILFPPIQTGQFYNVVVTGGTLITLNNNLVVVEWNEPGMTTGQICATLIGTDCPGEEACFEIEILDVIIPDQIFVTSPLCEGENSFATVMGNPDVTNYIWELTNLTEISGNGTSTISYVAGNEGTATVCLYVESICGISDPICEDIEIISSSPPEIFITSDLCSFEFTLTSNITTGSDIQWSFISGPGIPDFSNPNDQTTNVLVPEAGIYVIGVEENNNGCIGMSTITIEILPPLELVSSTFECNSQQEYQVLLTISGGEQPYSINNSTIVGEMFTSDLIPSGDPYSFTIEDNAGCVLTTIAGIFDCLCTTSAGTMSGEQLEVCAEEGSTVQGFSNLDTTMVDGDIGLYYLHDSPGFSLGNIIDFNTTGVFEFQAGIEPGVTYYISLVVGQAQSESIDLTNSCTFVSSGQPVVFYPKPTVSWEVPDTICGNSFFVRLFDQSFLESSSWEFVSGPTEMTITTSGDTSYFSAPVSDVYVYDLQLFNSWCDTTITFTFDVPADPQLTNLSQDCTLDPAFYVLSFEVVDGVAPFTSSISGSFNGNIFESELLDVTQTYTVIVTDFNGCEISLEVNTVNCSCDISIGTISTDSILLCTGDLLDPAVISSEDYQFDEDIYSVFYYTYNSATDAVEDFIEFSDGATFDQLPEYESGVVYYIRLIISQPQADITNGLLLNDPCLSISEPVPFKWNEDLEFVFDTDVIVCLDEGFYEFDQNFTGPFPYEVAFINQDGIIAEFVIDEVTETLSFPIYLGISEWELNSYDGSCDYNFSGNLTITGEEPVSFSLANSWTLCNNTLFGSIINFDEAISNPLLDGIWSLDGVEITDSFIDFDGFLAGNYSITFSSNGGSDSCPTETDTMEVILIACDCPIVTMTDQNVCSSETSLDLSIFTMTAFAGEFQVSNINNLGNPPTLSTSSTIDLTGVTPGEYEIIYTLTDPWPVGCDIVFSAILDISYQFLSGTAKDTVLVCQGDDLKIPLYDLLEGYDDGGVWFYLDLPVGDTIFTQGLSIGLWEYTYVIEPSFPCELQTTNVQIEVTPYPDVAVNSEDVLCFGDTNGLVEIEIFNDFFGPFNCFLDGNEITDKEITGLGPGTYTVEISTEDGCSVVFDSISIGEPSVVEVELGNDLLAFYNDELTIEGIINLLQSDISEITWEDLGGVLDEDDLVLIQEALSDNTIFLTITDEYGCIGLDSINIRLLERDITLPNIFVPNSENDINTRFGMPYIASVDEVLEFRIYDRWGNNVFAADGVEPDSEEGYWYGDYKGQAVQQGVFAYYLKYRTVSGLEKIIVGDVTVMR